ncbi:cilia- and flagella-associated protein 65 [Thalassophryne amazonica]|uniref:cilia- and flagella-associated protein 65 n=1 Tax=Thalassophryne amazonica TaxID=390379 RepID=UPI00147240E1|nr:cilia- and flagella-associated protein 65 [Thalassophryne amazonica]
MFASRPDPLSLCSQLKTTPAKKNIKHPDINQRRPRATSKRTCFFGVETCQELLWEDWELEKDFTKILVLKNIHCKLQKLHFRPPLSRFFTTLPPQIIILSPGTSFSMPVSFRPFHRCDYEESIEFECKDGTFQVFLRAIIPRHAVELPDTVLLPLCAVQHSSHTTFQIKNISKLQTCFRWEYEAPFDLSPEEGLLKPGQECCITVVFQPQEALVYQKLACCRFGEEGVQENCCTVMIQGTAKYPYIQMRILESNEKKQQGSPVLDFGSVAVGYTLEKHFEIFNPSPVMGSFSLSRLSGGMPLLGSEFKCDVIKGKVAAGGSLHVTVTFTPAVVDTVSVEYVSVKCKGSLNKSLLKLTGNCVGPKIALSSSVVDFGCIDEGGMVVRTVKLLNSSAAEAVYQWDLDCGGHSVFTIQPAGGTVGPYNHITVKVVYRPTCPIAHYRKVACVILHRDPVFLDLIGTCHSELQKPAVLKPEHLILYQLQSHCEVTHDQLDLQQDDGMQLEQQEIKKQSNQRTGSVAVLTITPMEEYYQSCLGGRDTLSSCSSSLSPHVSVMPTELLFKHKTSSSLCSPSSQSVSITNHTGGKLSLMWTAAHNSPFSVSPLSSDLAPLKTTSFRVNYNPKQLNTFHGAQLECFAYYKGNCHVKDGPLCLPWCVTVRVIGHSFQPDKQHFIPNYSLKPPLVVFPALNALSYRTALLQNSGDLPLTFSLDPAHSPNPTLAASVVVVPRCGLVLPGGHQILTLRTTPTESSPTQGFSLQLQFNATKDTKELTVVSSVEKLCVSLEEESCLYFQPTALGTRTQRSHHIRNLSRLPLCFQWNIPESQQKLILVEPDAGELYPNERSVQIWSFSPLMGEIYELKPTLMFWPTQTPECNKSSLTLEVVGMGCKGTIEAEKTVINTGEILVGSCKSAEIPLVNKSLCSVSFCVSAQQTLLDKSLNYDPKTEPNALHLDCETGAIPSTTTLLLRLTITPHRQAQYHWTISYQTLDANGAVSSFPQKLCEVQAKAVFSTLQVTDGCSSGSAESFNKVQQWNLFSLDSFNKHLLSCPSPIGVNYRTPTKHSLRCRSSILTRPMLDFNFGGAPINSEPSVFVLMFHNPGFHPVDWAFLFPGDRQIELDYSTETGEFSSTELHKTKVPYTCLFSVYPRAGTLLAGQKKAVEFKYSHSFVGTNRLPVLFKFSHSREILLSFQGVTVERDRPYLHSVSSRHVFTSVNIGESPPRQMYEVYNAGAVPVRYKVDMTPMIQLQADNFNHPVLCCLNPEGEVQPGRTATLEWIFSPLEAKMYQMNIPIHTVGGDSMLVRFEGCGLSDICNISDTKLSAPCIQRTSFPGQLVFMSEDCMSFGDIPVGSRSSRAFFLTNVSPTETVLYKWTLSQQYKQVVEVRPDRGRLCPKETSLCFLTFTACHCPTVYQLDLICQITQEALLTHYNNELLQWEEEKKRQQDEFIITDKKLPCQKILIDKESEAPSISKGPPLRKYKTLPPIGSSSRCNTLEAVCPRVKRRAQRELANVWKRPEPPQPALLHLLVTAHSHGPLENFTDFFKERDKHSRCLQSVTSQRPQNTSSSSLPPAGIQDPERDSRPCLTSSPQKTKIDGSEWAAEFTDMCEAILLNTIQNLMLEADRREFDLTAHPRNIALRPVSARLSTAKEDKEKNIKEPGGSFHA